MRANFRTNQSPRRDEHAFHFFAQTMTACTLKFFTVFHKCHSHLGMKFQSNRSRSIGITACIAEFIARETLPIFILWFLNITFQITIIKR